HVLPGIDDGSHNMEESLSMLRTSFSQGVNYIVATSHFYATKHRISSFLEKRQKVYDSLCSQIEEEKKNGEEFPEIILGAEVAFFPGISHSEHLEDLTFQNTDLLLLEMPYAVWTENDLKEIEYIINNRKIKVMLAHLERFLSISGNKKAIQKLLCLPTYVQINAGSFDSWKNCRQIWKILKKKDVIFLGSDCHGIHHRVPNLFSGRNVLEKKMGKEYMEKMDKAAERLLQLEGK
ncbi:MAG: capsular polysaccharide biosynthesis protein, partial [Eubacterium sp.]|nr:capsular polysaccharide biosynthesis protein [Eubacterium sp.]